jgi:rSAM/selenodomain-associated transferase 1
MARRRASFAKHLVIMAKSPNLGRVKRRLGRDVGDVAAARFYRTCLSHTALRLAQDRRWRTVIAVDPDRDVTTPFWPSRRRIARLPQGKGDLGRRMQRLFAALPPGPAIIVGSDIPAIRPHHIAEAFRRLGGADAVLGPAPDGGYWLIGLKRSPRVLRPFAAVRWSSAYALADTVANLDGKRVAFAATLSDVDIAEDFRRERASAERLIPSTKMPQGHAFNLNLRGLL